MIVIAGKNNIAVHALNVLALTKNIPKKDIAIVCNRTESGKDGWQMSFRKHAAYLGINEIDLGEAENKADIFLSLEFDRIVIPKRFKTNSLFNIHFSILPKYKGMYTSILPILNREVSSGTTLHLIDSGIDTGDIIAQENFLIKQNDCSADIYYKYIKSSIDLFNNNIDSLLNKTWTAKPQPHQNSTYYSKKSIDFSKLAVDITNTAETIGQQIKAYSFRPYQLPKIHNKNIVNYKVLKSKSTIKSGLLLNENDLYIDMSTIDYNLRVYKDCRAIINQAIYNNDIKAFNKYIHGMPSIDDKDTNSWTPLMIACYMGRIDFVQELIIKGANVNAINYKGTTPLMYAKDYALKTGNIEILDLLLRSGADYNHKDFYNKSISDYTYNILAWQKIVNSLNL